MSEIESKRIFQKKFNQLLEERQITQKEIAGICNASTSTVSTWSKGTNMPRMDKIERLANYFGLPKSYFIEERPTPVPESGPLNEFQDLMSQLTPDEQRLIVSQIKGILSNRE